MPVLPLAARRRLDRPAAVSRYRERALTGAAACLWIGEAGWERTLRVVPDGCVDVVWDGTAIAVTRPADRAVRHHLAHTAPVLGIRLRPGWAGTVLGVNLATLDPVVDLRVLRGRRETARLAAAASAEGAVALIDWVGGRAEAAAPPGDLLRAVHDLDAGMPIGAVSRDVGYSPRQLRRRFEEHVGLSPTTFRQVRRFERFVRRPGPAGDLARTAFALGFADQAHLARTCRRLAGLSPGQLTGPGPERDWFS